MLKYIKIEAAIGNHNNISQQCYFLLYFCNFGEKQKIEGSYLW